MTDDIQPEVSDINRECPYCDGTGPFDLAALNCVWAAAGDEAHADSGLAAALELGYSADPYRRDRQKARDHRNAALRQFGMMGATPELALAVADAMTQFRRHNDRAACDLAELCMHRIECEHAEKPPEPVAR